MRKLIFKAFKKFMNHMPVVIQDEVVRRTIDLPREIPEGLVFKIAETEEELEATFRLVYDAYAKLGYCDENPYKLRATVYHALSTTSTVLAIDNGKVIGTVTIVRDNVFGLPSEKIFNLRSLRQQSQRLAEITSLVIHPDYRREKGGCILFTMLRFAHEYSTNYFGVDHLVVSVHPKDAFFYKSLLLFKDVPGTGVKDYMGAPAVALNLDLHKAFEDYQKVYSKRSEKEDMFNFFIKRQIPNLVFPKKYFNKINYPVVSEQYFQETFVGKLGIGEEIIEHRNVAILKYQMDFKRDAIRVDTELRGNISSDDGVFTYCGKVRDVSRSGFKLIIEQTLPVGMEFDCEIQIDSDFKSTVRAKAVWSNENLGMGFKIIKADANWYKYIDYLYQDQKGKVA